MTKYQLHLPIATHKIACIKLIRTVTGMGLKEAKDFVEGSEPIIIETKMSQYEIRQAARDRCLIHTRIGIDIVPVPVDPDNVPEAKEIETTGTQLFNIPNDEEGKQFLISARKYMNRSRYGRFRKKGRGSNRPKTMGGDLRISEAEWFAVYVDESDDFRHTQWERERERDERMRKSVKDELIRKIETV